MSDKKMSPFSNGLQFDDWCASNCDRCQKQGKCPIEGDLLIAFFDDGLVSEETARRMGRLDNGGKYNWPCGEVEWTETWRHPVWRRSPARKDGHA